MKAQLYRALTLFLTAALLLLGANAHALSPAEAAEQASNSTGGKVLQVKSRKDGNYRVKILMPNGQVRNISVGNSSESKPEKGNNKGSSKKQ